MSTEISTLIPAAGLGERLGMGSKALLELHGKTLLHWVTRVALQCSDEVLVTYPSGARDTFASVCPACLLVEGGPSRQASISRLLQASSGKWLVIADVVRPFITQIQIESVLAEAQRHGIAGLFLEPDVPVVTVEDGMVGQHWRKDDTALVQSPQAYRRDILLDIHDLAERGKWQEQSTIQLAINAGYPVKAVPGSKSNFKITSAEDWILAKQLARSLLK